MSRKTMHMLVQITRSIRAIVVLFFLVERAIVVLIRARFSSVKSKE